MCGKCTRLQRICVWSDDLQLHAQRNQYGAMSSASASSRPRTIQLSRPDGQSFVVEFPNIDRATMPYLHHFVTFCCRFLVYANDSEGNPFQCQLVPQAVSSPALLHAMAAVAAGHWARSETQHNLSAAKHYSLALTQLKAALSDPNVARSDSTLGACLLLCVYEVGPMP